MAARSPSQAVVADDSHFVRSVITDVLEGGGIDVVDVAKNGREAVDMVSSVDPDVVTVDIETPETDGIEATERVMTTDPTPVLMSSTHPGGNADVTFQALEKGAVGGPLVGVILTKMGRDGAAGVRAVAGAGGTTIAQDEATTGVFGMPKRAIETGCVDGVGPVDDVAAAVLDALEVA